MKRLIELSRELRMGPDSYDIDVPLNRIDGLVDLIEEIDIKNKTVCEIGCFLGVSTETFALFNPKQLYAIDIWGLNEDYEDLYANRKEGWLDTETLFKERMKKYKNINMIKDFSVNAAERFEDNSIDVVYIDAEHSYEAVTRDLEAWFPKVKMHGYICGHDFYDDVRTAVSKFVVNYLIKHGPRNWQTPIKQFSDTSWLFKKIWKV